MTFSDQQNDTWRDMSEYVVHFTKGSMYDNGYGSVMQILSSGKVEGRNVFGIGRD
jgi:hypothetical protein